MHECDEFPDHLPSCEEFKALEQYIEFPVFTTAGEITIKLPKKIYDAIDDVRPEHVQIFVRERELSTVDGHVNITAEFIKNAVIFHKQYQQDHAGRR